MVRATGGLKRLETRGKEGPGTLERTREANGRRPSRVFGIMDEDLNDNAPAPRVGATTELPHDRVTVARFREAFPRARWSDSLNAWFVPGRTARKRISRWLAEMEAEADAFADEKGRDAFAFDPIESRYLKAAPASFEIRTPCSRTVVNEIREIPYVVGCGPCLTARSTSSAVGGQPSRRPLSAVNRRRGRRGVRQ